MFDVADSLPIGELHAGSYLLAGPAMSGKYQLMLDFVTEGIQHDDAILFVTTNDSANHILEDLEERLGALPEWLRIVDCVSEHNVTDDHHAPERVEYVSSPADLTGIGISVSEQLSRLAQSGAERTRICFYSLSTLLTYTELEAVFRFLHVLSGRVDSFGGLGLFALDPTPHEDSTVNTIEQLFDGVIEVRVDGERQSRIVGIPGGGTDWGARP